MNLLTEKAITELQNLSIDAQQTSHRLYQITKISNDQFIRSPRSTKKKSPHC